MSVTFLIIKSMKSTVFRLFLVFCLTCSLQWLPGQHIKLAQDTVLHYYKPTSYLAVGLDMIYFVDYQISRKFIDANTFADIKISRAVAGIDTIIADTFRVKNGAWYKKINGRYRLFFSEKWFKSNKRIKFSYKVDNPFTKKIYKTSEYFTPVVKISETEYVISVYKEQLRREYKICFDPRIGVITRRYGEPNPVILRGR
ncbi:MAG: hypothetical protein EAZ89_10050 [Bacteroidetes bacterium]|nr:MAG: hypothetical protein EAZ89_10050 [Bacteroidota bacterium]